MYHNSSDVKWAARVIDLYKSDIGQSKSKRSNVRRSNSQAAQAVTRTASNRGLETLSSNKKVWTIDEISRLKPWEYEKLEKDIDAAARDGRIVDAI